MGHSDNAGYGSNGVTAKEAYMVANAAMKLAEEHIRDCRDFRKDLRDRQDKATKERGDMHIANQGALQAARTAILAEVASVHARVDRLYGRAWAVVIAIMALEGGGLLYFVKVWMEAHK